MILTLDTLDDTKEYLQNIDNDTIESWSNQEFKEHIRNATRILLIEQDNFGYSMEELMFYITLRFKTLTENKSKNYIKDRITEAIKETSYISTENSLISGKKQKKFLVRT